MKVERLIVYRVVNFEEDVKKNGSAIPSKWKMRSEFKQRLEVALEKERPDGLPTRGKCLFVCFSTKNACEWAKSKYGKKDTPYKLLTLEVSGNIFWLKADCYNFLQPNSSQEEFDKAAMNYWNSVVEDKSMLTLDEGYEGLFVGENKIIDIEYKNYINGESVDVE